MAKTIYDYDSQEENNLDENAFFSGKVGTKRTHQETSQNTYLEKLMLNQQKMITDIEKHCKNKRMKKNIYKMDCIRMGSKQHQEQMQAAASAANTAVIMPDPVIDYQFKMRNVYNYQHIMQDHTNALLQNKGYLPINIFDNDMKSQQKL